MTEEKEAPKEIWLVRDFTNQSCLEVREKIIEISKEDPKVPIIVYINSYGGNVDSLNMLIDTFASVPNEIITACSGTAMSAGAFLLSCGHRRFMSPNSRVMIHQVSSASWGNVDDIKNETEETVRINQRLLQILSKNTGKSVKQLEKLLKEKRELYLTAEEALDFGLVDFVGLPYLEKKTTYEVVWIR